MTRTAEVERLLLQIASIQMPKEMHRWMSEEIGVCASTGDTVSLLITTEVTKDRTPIGRYRLAPEFLHAWIALGPNESADELIGGHPHKHEAAL